MIEKYEQIDKDARTLLSKMAQHSSNEMLKEIAEETDEKEDHDRDVNCRVIRMIVDECLEEYHEGEYDLDTTVKNITESISAIKDTRKK